MFDTPLEHRPAIRLVHAIGEGAQLLSPHLNFVIGLPDQFGGIADPWLSRLLIERQRLVLIDLRLIEDREAVLSFLFEISRVIVEPAVRAADGEAVVLA